MIFHTCGAVAEVVAVDSYEISILSTRLVFDKIGAAAARLIPAIHRMVSPCARIGMQQRCFRGIFRSISTFFTFWVPCMPKGDRRSPGSRLRIISGKFNMSKSNKTISLLFVISITGMGSGKIEKSNRQPVSGIWIVRTSSCGYGIAYLNFSACGFLPSSIVESLKNCKPLAVRSAEYFAADLVGSLCHRAGAIR